MMKMTTLAWRINMGMEGIQMFQQKMNEFKEADTKYQAIIADLNDQLKELELKITKNNEAYHRALMMDIEEKSKKTQADLSKNLRLAEEYGGQLEDLKKRIEIARYLREEKLKELLPELKVARDKVIEEATEEVKENRVKAFERKAQYILFIRDLNLPHQRVREAKEQFLKVCHLVGVHDFDRDFSSLPRFNMVSTYEGLHASLAPTEEEIMVAYNRGTIPHFVKLYEMTGEILPDYDAWRKLEQMQKEAKVNG